MTSRRHDHLSQLDTACEQRGLWIELTATNGHVDSLRIRNARTKKVVGTRDITAHPREIDTAAAELLHDLTAA